MSWKDFSPPVMWGSPPCWQKWSSPSSKRHGAFDVHSRGRVRILVISGGKSTSCRLAGLVRVKSNRMWTCWGVLTNIVLNCYLFPRHLVQTQQKSSDIYTLQARSWGFWPAEKYCTRSPFIYLFILKWKFLWAPLIVFNPRQHQHCFRHQRCTGLENQAMSFLWAGRWMSCAARIHLRVQPG